MSGSRKGIIEIVTNPLGFFTLMALIIETVILTSVFKADLPPETNLTLLIFAISVLVLLILVVAFIAWKNPHVLREEPFEVSNLCHSLGSEIFYAIDGYIQNSSDPEEIREAYQSLISAIESPTDEANREVRSKIAEVIKTRAKLED